MPWTCDGCGIEVETDEGACPTCAAPKTSWTMVREQTRTFVLAGKRFEVLRGPGRAPAERAPVVSKDEARRRAARGDGPPPDAVLYVRLHAKPPTDLTVTLTLEFERAEALEAHLSPPEGLGSEGWADVPLLLVHGAGPIDDLGFDGVQVIDASEEQGFAPEVEVAALGKPARALPTEAATTWFLSARLLDRAGAAVLADRALTVEGAPARTDADGLVVVPDVPCKLLALDLEGGRVLVPAVHDPAIVADVRLRFVAQGGAAARSLDDVEGEPGRPASLYAAGPADVDDDDDDPEDHGPLGCSDAPPTTWRLSARFLDRSGARLVTDRALTVEGVPARTDASGHVVVDDLPCKLLSVVFDEGQVLVPAVHDAGIVADVRLRFVAQDDASARLADEVAADDEAYGRPATLYAASPGAPDDDDDDDPEDHGPLGCSATPAAVAGEVDA